MSDPMQLPETGIEPRSLASQTHGYRPAVSPRFVGLLLAALSGALVAGSLMFFVGRASAAPRSAPASSGSWTLLEAPHGASPFAPPPTTGTRPASVGASPDLRTPPATYDSGTATWYDDGSGLYAAVPSYRWGDQRYKVKVCNRSDDCVTVTVRDFCGCPGDRIIDLSPAAFRKLAPLSQGIVAVTVQDLREGPSVTPPATDR